MTPKAITFRPDADTHRELEALAALRDVTASDAIRAAIHEAYVREQYREAAAELAAWRNDPAYQTELAEVRADMEELRAW
ncbi:ribbon-helix-helix protein, CopG family [Streptomyces sp. MUM 203J]|uniref:ribbon-helix-helix protein, CopG family n=1 Tax=Streptomyces sp. MUM 203J TaxID=2791990 RepID=UPI001F03D2BF|nr:ribbon-helix-helix protein, CopG family [Streptomyces sp. MUM 203J]MCH0538292.1 ribbon-helix-helix protein, CopG family [Streptomyces sp. MUM 203J]